MTRSIKLAITMGDPGGIGPEIALKAVYRSKWPGSVRFVLIGNKNVWQKYARQLRLPPPYECKNIEEVDNSKISIWDPAPPSTVIPAKAGIQKICSISDWEKQAGRWIPTCVGMTKRKWRPGKTGKSEGFFSLLWIRAAVAGCLEGKFHGMVTGPICKHSICAADCRFAGHTEYLAHLAGAKQVAMMLIGGPLRVVPVTRHVALADVARKLSCRAVREAVQMADLAVKWLGLPQKTIGVCALNPHGGDNGLLGNEEKKIIIPAIKTLRRQGLKIDGPIPGDVIFHQALNNKFGAVAAMYHDQGLGPLKMIAFEKGVNLTLGLPFVRTSPDHGTAFDIAGRKKASAASMVAAIALAIRLANRPNPWKNAKNE